MTQRPPLPRSPASALAASLPPLRAVLGAGLLIGALLLARGAAAQENAGGNRAEPSPFAATEIARFDTPWALAALPGGGWLVTEKGGKLHRVGADGRKAEIAGVPPVVAQGQNGLLDIAIDPSDGALWLSAVVPGAAEGGDLALFTARLEGETLADLREVWRQSPAGGGGQPGGIIAFSPKDGALHLAVGDRMRPQSMGPGVMRGVILRFGAGGPDVVSSGHRNPYGLAFDAAGTLWEHEMGPRGGDELNRIEAGRDYGWPRVSWGNNYDGRDIPDHDTDPAAAAPMLYWTPVIAPAGLTVYRGDLFPQWRGALLIGGLRSKALIVVETGGEAAREVARFDMGARIRDVAEGADGALYVIEDAAPGRLLRLAPKG